MNSIAALLIVAAICQLSHADPVHELNLNVLGRLAPRSIGEKFKQALEDFKEVLRQGNATAGIPVLDPFNLKHYEFKLQNELVNLQGEVNNLLVEGLSNYIVQNADFKFVGKKVIVDFIWSGISAKAQYSVPSGLVLAKYPAYGAGDVSIKASDFHFATQANIKIDMKADRVSVLSFSNTTIALRDLEVKISGLFEDDELSALVSAVISENFADFLKDFNGDIVNFVNQAMLEQANDGLKDLSFKELMKKLRG